jgi:Chalcone isomerase-like
MKYIAKDNGFIQAVRGLVLCIVCLLTVSAQAANIGGIELKESIKLGETNLLLNGAGQRTKLFIDLYIAALYLADKTDDAQAIIDADEVMLIQIHVISNLITSENITQGTSEGFIKSTGNNTAAIQGQIHEFLTAFKEPIVTGDTFEIVYQPGKGVTVLKNRHIVKKLPENKTFKRALFGIWLSEQPAQASLKTNLLGK